MNAHKKIILRSLKRMRIRLIYGILVIVLMASCNRNSTFDHYTSIDGNWGKDEVISYDFTITDSIKKNNLFFKIRTSEDYKYSNLYLIVDLKYPNGKLLKDTLEYQMARPDGSMLGDGLMNIKEHKLWHKGHQNPFVFSEIGDYTISIRQAMRALNNVSGLKSLEGVLDVGFSMENLDQ